MKLKGVLLVGLGNKARNGKDYSAKIIQNELSGICKILHWADALYEEVSNKKREYPLIRKTSEDPEDMTYILFDKEEIYEMAPHQATLSQWSHPSKTVTCYRTVSNDKVLHELMKTRLDESGCYYGMDYKDPLLLQYWGTNYRRKYDSDYWIKAAKRSIDNLLAKRKDLLKVILMPDTRFKNEYDFIKNNGGIYIKVIATVDGKQYIDPKRDPNHPSEVALDDVPYDFLIKAERGDLESLSAQALAIAGEIKSLLSLKTSTTEVY